MAPRKEGRRAGQDKEGKMARKSTEAGV